MAHAYTAPADAAELWERDGGFVYSLTRKLLGPEVSAADAEDAAAEIIERLLVSVNDKGETILGQYSAGYVSERTGQPVTWRSFLSGKVARYCRGKRESIARRNGRELLLCDTEAGDGGERWVELFGGRVWDDYPSLTDEEFEQRMRDYLAALPGAWEGPGSLFDVFNEVLDRVKSGERATQVAGLTRKQTALALVRIRELSAAAMAAPPRGPVAVAGVELTLAEARDALDRLRGASGNHVHRALAGHRLMAEGRKGWYHAFAKAELAAYPGCAVEAWAGKVGGAGNGHVKAAVIHGLQRLLAGAPEEPEPAPSLPDEVSRAELLEAELWRITGLDAARIDAIIAAAERVYA
jgi:hypothetical protein